MVIGRLGIHDATALFAGASELTAAAPLATLSESQKLVQRVRGGTEVAETLSPAEKVWLRQPERPTLADRLAAMSA
jgi:hypothetical protein